MAKKNKLKKSKPVKKIARKKPVKLSKSKKAKRVKGQKPKRAPMSEEAVLALIEKGRHRGFVTQAEIINAFPHLETDIKGLEMLYDRLESANVNIIESGRVFEEEKAREYDEKKKVELELEGGSSSDSVQMYLREIGQYPLLSSEEDIELAKKIEKNDEAARQKLAVSNLRLVVSRSEERRVGKEC